jgi:metacaspase-1
MADPHRSHVFLSYSGDVEPFVESIALRLRGDARLSFWFAPWHSVPGEDRQTHMEKAVAAAETCAAFIGPSRRFSAWQNERARAAIEARAETTPTLRVVPVLLPGAPRPRRFDLPPFLRQAEPIEFRSDIDEQAYNRLLAGILNLSPGKLHAQLRAYENMQRIAPPSSSGFERGHALLIGAASYERLYPLPDVVRSDVRDLSAVLVDPARAAFPKSNVVALLDEHASRDNIRAALADLAARVGPADTVILFFSGHSAHRKDDAGEEDYLLPYDADPTDLPGTAIAARDLFEHLGAIKAGRLLVVLDAGHSIAARDLDAIGPDAQSGLRESFYHALASGPGRAVIASCRSGEVSFALPGMKNSLFAHYLLEALRGQTKSLGDGYVRVFDIFRHVAERVPVRARQRPLFKARPMDYDFAVALASR